MFGFIAPSPQQVGDSNALTLRNPRAKCPYYEGFRWAQPDKDHLVHLMRYVYENREEAAAKGARASEKALSCWTWRQAAQKIKDRLLTIHSSGYLR